MDIRRYSGLVGVGGRVETSSSMYLREIGTYEQLPNLLLKGQGNKDTLWKL